MYNLVDLRGKVILVAGASSGIGRQTAITLSKLGAQLVLVARSEDKLLSVLSELEGDGHEYRCADLSVIDSIGPLLQGIVDERGPFDGLVYSVGVSTSMPLRMFKPEKIKGVFEINFFAFIETIRQITMRGRFSEGMRIVGVSSTASMRGSKANTAYTASKAAMNGAVMCMAKELAEKGICINNVAPAMTSTEMYEEYLSRAGESSASNVGLLERQYLGIAKTEDIANAIAFLISPAARFITGITLPVDGGTTTS